MSLLECPSILEMYLTVSVQILFILVCAQDSFESQASASIMNSKYFMSFDEPPAPLPFNDHNEFNLFTEDSVPETISKVKNNYLCSRYAFTSQQKTLISYLAVPLINLSNVCFAIDTIPECWKPVRSLIV